VTMWGKLKSRARRIEELAKYLKTLEEIESLFNVNLNFVKEKILEKIAELSNWEKEKLKNFWKTYGKLDISGFALTVTITR